MQKKRKQYTLGKISKNESPAGYSITTNGISIKYPTFHSAQATALESSISEAL